MHFRTLFIELCRGVLRDLGTSGSLPSSVILLALGNAAAVAAMAPPVALASRCTTEFLIDGMGGGSFLCVNPCSSTQGCSLYSVSVPTYGAGQTCGCAFGGISFCCDLVAGWDPGVEDWFTVGHGNCGIPDEPDPLCSPGACMVTGPIKTQDGDHYTAGCEEEQ